MILLSMSSFNFELLFAQKVAIFTHLGSIWEVGLVCFGNFEA